MLNKFISVLLLFFSVPTMQGQSILSGKIEYTLTWDLNEYYMADAEPKSEKQKLVEDSIMKKLGVNNNKISISKYLIIFDKSQVETFRTKDLINTPQIYQDFLSRTSLSIGVTASQKYLVLDTITTISWNLLKDTKKIQNIDCFSAQAEYRGRVWTAWYAPSIPISSGPWKLYGLPGFILEAEDKTGAIKFECNAVIVPKPKDLVIDKKNLTDTKNKIINHKEYAKSSKKSIENYEKMNKTKDEGMTRGVSDIEIFDFEERLGLKRKQQKRYNASKK